MKKFTLLSFFVFSIFLVAAQVDRNMVLVEIGTGTWCVYCPGAAMGADDLIENGWDVAVIENHNGDAYANEYSNARNSYYSISGYPTAHFDGSYDDYVGGSNTVSMYSNYYPIVEARMMMATTHIMEIYGTNSGDEYSITLRIQKNGTYSSDDLKVRLALTESDIDVEWQGYSGLNFVNRLMVPDAEGTSIASLDDGYVFDVELDFTFDNTWVDSNCELVAFIQDDATKEVIQTVKVALNSLVAPPPLLSATFESDEPTVCTEGYITYTPDFSGSGLSYNWTFEGATPSTSTEQSPTVYYNTTGTFNVGLTVSDGTFTDSDVENDYMPVILPVQTPNQPTGETELCGAYYYTFSTSLDTYATQYTWQIVPSDAGTLTWNNNTATLEASNSWSGDFTIKVMCSNYCGASEWSDELTCSLSSSPTEFMLEGGGGYCYGGDGVEIYLSDSETGVDYELYFEGDPTGNVVEGTGNSINFGLLTEEGSYTVLGSNESCNWQMMNQVEVEILFAPVEPDMPTGPQSVCNTEATEYVSGGGDGDNFVWELSPETAGTLDVNGLTATVTWNNSFEGTATLSIAGQNACGIGNSADLNIEVDAIPAPEVSGQSTVCDTDIEDYSTQGNPGNTYTWEVTGGTITNGQGTETITVEWGTPGTGTVAVMEQTLAGCEGNSEMFDVIIDNCTAIDENLANHFEIYPNPASSQLNVTFGSKSQDNCSIVIYSHIGQVVYNEKIQHTAGIMNIDLDISAYNSGLYVIKIQSGDEILASKKFIKK